MAFFRQRGITDGDGLTQARAPSWFSSRGNQRARVRGWLVVGIRWPGWQGGVSTRRQIMHRLRRWRLSYDAGSTVDWTSSVWNTGRSWTVIDVSAPATSTGDFTLGTVLAFGWSALVSRRGRHFRDRPTP
jgi:hypothetical protein